MKECSVTVQGFIFMYVYIHIYIYWLYCYCLLLISMLSPYIVCFFFLGYREAFAAPAVFVNLMPFCNWPCQLSQGASIKCEVKYFTFSRFSSLLVCLSLLFVHFFFFFLPWIFCFLFWDNKASETIFKCPFSPGCCLSQCGSFLWGPQSALSY